MVAQSDEVSPLVKCSLVENGDFFSGTPTVVTTDALTAAGSKLQVFVDCVSPHGSIIIDAPSVDPISTTAINKPVRLETSDVVGKAVISCSSEGTVFDIRSHDVGLSNFIFANCSVDDAAAVQVEDCGPGQNQVDIVGVEFLSKFYRNCTAGVTISG